MFLSIGFFIVIASEMLNEFLAISFGFKPEGLGIFWAATLIVSAFLSQLTPTLRKLVKGNALIIIIGILVSITFLISPLLGIVLGGISIDEEYPLRPERLFYRINFG